MPGCSAGLAGAARYERDHQVPVYERGTIPMVTPGGMVFEQPRMVLATDSISITEPAEGALCVELLTIGRNRAECRIVGIARLQEDGQYLLGPEGSAIVRLQHLSQSEFRIEPIGRAYEQFCEPGGRIQPAVYSARR